MSYSSIKVALVTKLLTLYDEAVTQMPTSKLRKWIIAGVRPTAYDSSKVELQEWISQLQTDMKG